MCKSRNYFSFHQINSIKLYRFSINLTFDLCKNPFGPGFFAGMFGGIKEMLYICSEKSVITIKYILT